MLENGAGQPIVNRAYSGPAPTTAAHLTDNVDFLAGNIFLRNRMLHAHLGNKMREASQCSLHATPH